MASKFNPHIIPHGFLSILLLLLTSTHVDVAAQSSPPAPQQSTNSQYGYFNQSSFNPSMAIVIIVLIAVFFFLGFFSIYIRQCAGDGITGTGPNNTQLIPTSIRRPKGLDPQIIESLPTMVYSEVKEHKIGKGALECAVCLSEFEDDETLRLLPKCSHVFHHDCIDAWFAGHATCPVCRYNLWDYKKGDMPSLDTNTNAMTAPPETATEITRQLQAEAEDRPVDPPSQLLMATDAVVLEVRPETEAEQTEREEAEELERIASRRRALRSKSSRRPVRFPRSHSTGHESSTERYTLRIPDHVLRQIIADGKLKRTTSLLFFGELAGEGSCRPAAVQGQQIGEGSSRGGRSVRMFVRNLSERFSAWGMGRRGDGEGSCSVKGEGSYSKGNRLGAVRVPFDCLAAGAGATEKAESVESGRGMPHSHSHR